MLVKDIGLLLLIHSFWPTKRYILDRDIADVPSILTCPVAQPIPIKWPLSTWDQDIAEERASLEAIDVFDLPEARRILELDRSIEQYARYSLIVRTRRYWDVACLFTTIAYALQDQPCADLVQLMVRGGEFLRLEESKIEDEATQLQYFHKRAGLVSAAVTRDAQLAQQVQFSGEDDPILIQQNVQAENSLIQWTHLPGRLEPHFIRTTEICDSAMGATAEIALGIRDLREHFGRVTKLLSTTPRTFEDCRTTLVEVRGEIFEAVLRFLGIEPTEQYLYSYYLNLFGLTNTSTQTTRTACPFWQITYSRYAE